MQVSICSSIIKIMSMSVYKLMFMSQNMRINLCKTEIFFKYSSPWLEGRVFYYLTWSRKTVRCEMSSKYTSPVIYFQDWCKHNEECLRLKKRSLFMAGKSVHHASFCQSTNKVWRHLNFVSLIHQALQPQQHKLDLLLGVLPCLSATEQTRKIRF